jgi:hypothetical protein
VRAWALLLLCACGRLNFDAPVGGDAAGSADASCPIRAEVEEATCHAVADGFCQIGAGACGDPDSGICEPLGVRYCVPEEFCQCSDQACFVNAITMGIQTNSIPYVRTIAPFNAGTGVPCAGQTQTGASLDSFLSGSSLQCVAMRVVDRYPTATQTLSYLPFEPGGPAHLEITRAQGAPCAFDFAVTGILANPGTASSNTQLADILLDNGHHFVIPFQAAVVYGCTANITTYVAPGNDPGDPMFACML